MTEIVLEQKAAQYAQTIVKSSMTDNLESIITKSLGVLQEQGIYALILFLMSRSREKEDARNIINQLFSLTGEIFPNLCEHIEKIRREQTDAKKNSQILQFYSEHILNELEILFLVRDLYEQVLIYARYSVKAQNKYEALLKSEVVNDESSN